MGVVQVSLPSALGEIIEREVEAGRAPSADAYGAEAVRFYLKAEDEIVAVAVAGLADIEGGRFTARERLRTRFGDQRPRAV